MLMFTFHCGIMLLISRSVFVDFGVVVMQDEGALKILCLITYVVGFGCGSSYYRFM